MISPTRKAEAVEVDGFDGERRTFTIKPNGKAFRALIDGLYSNKIGSMVREVLSNALDSHAAVGKQAVPVSVVAPTTLEPIFRVRDFGESMSHDTVMNLYSTIFESSKEDTNEQVGRFGLGSKSPFAYTDTFSVIAILDGVKRIYVATIDETDVPSITHLATEETDEPQGVEVTVPVRAADVSKFQAEIARMVFSCPVRPEVDGLVYDLPTPIAEGEGWRVVRDEFDFGRFAIRQGFVTYPVRDVSLGYEWPVAHDHTLIVDVPIGSVEVTASRESVSMTTETRAAVEAARDAGQAACQAFVDAIEFPNRLEHYRKSNDYSAFPTFKRMTHLKLTPDKPNKNLTGTYLNTYRSAKKLQTVTSVQAPHTVRLLVDDGSKILRRNLRIAAFLRRCNPSYNTVAVVRPDELPRLVRVLGLKRDQVISLHSLPDVEPAAYSGGAGGNAGKFVAPKKVTDDRIVVIKTGAKTIGQHIGEAYIREIDDFAYAHPFLNWLGVDTTKIVFLTEKQAAAQKISSDRLLNNVVRKLAAQKAKGGHLQKRLDQDQDRYLVDRVANGINTVLDRLYGWQRGQARRALIDRVRTGFFEYAQVSEEGTQRFDADLARVLGISGKNSLTEADLFDKVEEIANRYPHLHGEDQDVFEALLASYENKENNK